MLAVDTNIVVRLLTRDHAGQTAKAVALVEAQDVLVPTTVLLETEWVLRRVYGFSTLEIVAAIRSLLGLERLCVEHPRRIADALAWHEQGMDLADAFHLASADGCEAFVTFDRQLIRDGAQIGLSVRAP